MKESGKYHNLWRKYLQAIKILIKNSKKGLQKLPMSKHEFEIVGEREKAGYQFNLEFSQALQQAKLKMIDEGKYAHPFYWLPFILIGKK